MINVYHISDVMALFQTLIHKAPLASLVSRYSTPRVLYPNSITMTSRQMWIRNKTDSPVWFDTPTTFTHRLYRVGCNLTIPFGIEQFIPCQFVWNIFRLDLIKQVRTLVNLTRTFPEPFCLNELIKVPPHCQQWSYGKRIWVINRSKKYIAISLVGKYSLVLDQVRVCIRASKSVICTGDLQIDVFQ